MEMSLYEEKVEQGETERRKKRRRRRRKRESMCAVDSYGI